MGGTFALHLVTDRLESRLPLDAAIAAAVLGGVDGVQVREKGRPADETLRAALRAREAAAGRAAVLVNDRVDVALAAGAAGAHLPARGLPPAAARALLPRDGGWLLGVSVHSLAAARAAISAGADYVTFGHVYASASKAGLPARGLAALAEVAAAVPAPVLAIGGIGPDNVGAVLATGCAGVAVIRALLSAADPERAAAALRDAMERVPGHPRHPLPPGRRGA